MSFVDFLIEYYVWILTVLVVLIVGIIGFLVDSKNKDKNKVNKVSKKKKSKEVNDVSVVGDNAVNANDASLGINQGMGSLSTENLTPTSNGGIASIINENTSDKVEDVTSVMPSMEPEMDATPVMEPQMNQ